MYGGMHLVCVHVARAVCSVYMWHWCAYLGLCAGYVYLDETVWGSMCVHAWGHVSGMSACMKLFGLCIHTCGYTWNMYVAFMCISGVCACVGLCGEYVCACMGLWGVCIYACMKLWGIYACLGLWGVCIHAWDYVWNICACMGAGSWERLVAGVLAAVSPWTVPLVLDSRGRNLSYSWCPWVAVTISFSLCGSGLLMLHF